MSNVEIIAGVAGSGKSTWCRERLLELPGAWLVLPLEELCAAWRDDGAVPATTIMTLPGLASQLAAPLLAGREIATPALRLLILRQVLRETARPEGYFGRVAHTAGFVRTLSDLIRELQQNEADAGRLADAVCAAAAHVADGSFASKGAEIAALYRAYARYLHEHRLLDGDNVVSLAIRRVREDADSVP